MGKIALDVLLHYSEKINVFFMYFLGMNTFFRAKLCSLPSFFGPIGVYEYVDSSIMNFTFYFHWIIICRCIGCFVCVISEQFLTRYAQLLFAHSWVAPGGQ